MSEFSKLVEAVQPKLDTLGRRNKGWTINRMGRGGRPREFDTRQSIAISNEDWALVKTRAAKEGVSASELVRLFITWGLENDE